MPRPVVFVLAGVNGAGKSSIGGYVLSQAGESWYNPDSFARELVSASGCDQMTANARAWAEGMRRLQAAISDKKSFAFETTLGGSSMTHTLQQACKSHDVLVWFCGLATPQLHIERVRARVRAGGHDIPEGKIRERFNTARLNLIRLMPVLAELRVFDNTKEAGADGAIPDPPMILAMQRGKIAYPLLKDIKAQERTPDWAKPLVQAAIQLSLEKRKKKPRD